jgi:hypothetical protein
VIRLPWDGRPFLGLAIIFALLAAYMAAHDEVNGFIFAVLAAGLALLVDVMSRKAELYERLWRQGSRKADPAPSSSTSTTAPEAVPGVHQRQLTLLDRCIEFAGVSAPSIERVGDSALAHDVPDDATQLAVAAAVSFLIAMVDSCACLIRAKKLPAAFALSRTVLLGLADLINLSRDPNYPLHMDSARMDQWLRFFGRHARRPNPLVRPMENEFNLEDEAADLRAFQEETLELGGTSLTDADRLQRAGMSDEHGSVYWLWSLYSHANLGALSGTHYWPDRDGVTRFHFRPRDDLNALITVTDGLIGMTLSALQAAFQRLGLDVTGLGPLRRELTDVRAALGLRDEPPTP